MHKDFKTGDIVISFLGHDEGKLLVVIGVGERLIVADGDTRPIAKRKTKNAAHVRYRGCVDGELQAAINKGTVEDYMLRNALKAFIKDN